MFKKYPSAENHYRNKFTEKCYVHFGHEYWVATEKIHGSNFGWWANINGVECSKRNSMIPAGENFHNHLSLVPKYESIVKSIYEYLRLAISTSTDDMAIAVFGEIYGKGCQKGVFYSDTVDFIMFDIAVQDGNDFYWLSYDALRGIEMKFGMPMVPEVKRGNFHEVLEHVNEFDSIVGGIEDNNAEGFVMKPVSYNAYLPSGERAMIKSKGEKWREKSHSAKKVKVPQVLTEEEQYTLNVFCQYLTKNRLVNVLSKIGDVKAKQFGMVAGLFMQDALTDFGKENKVDISPVQKKCQNQAMIFVRGFWVDILNKEL